jgi:CDP-diacylglycerol--glycerol-3-phosphate 3-phosphatidyltransferase
MIPVMVLFLMLPYVWCQIVAALVFALASLTDWFDGYYARKHKMVTDFGKLMDPMADKLLVMAALVGLLAQGRVHYLAVMVLLGRELIVSGIRLLALSKGNILAADSVGKWKTATQMAALILIMAGAHPCLTLFSRIGGWLLWISALLSIWSCVGYAAQNWEGFTK